MYRFLLSRRWVGFALLMVVLAIACVQLSRWQFDRLEARRDQNALIERNLAAPPRDVTDVLRADEPVPAQREWRRVHATGTFDPRQQVLVRYQSRDGRLGFDVVTPLVTGEGTAVLVDRGFVASGEATATPRIPPPPSGQVRITGWVRADQDGDPNLVQPQGGQVRLISSDAIAATLPYPAFGGYVAMTGVRPKPEVALLGPQPPETSSGPHFFYGLQWLFFAVLAVGGWFLLARTEARERRRPPPVAAHPGVREDAATR